MSLWEGEHKDETETILHPEFPEMWDCKAMCYRLFLCYT